MGAVSEFEVRRTPVESVRDEATAVRGLLEQCREHDLAVDSVDDRIRTAREYVSRRDLPLAFEVLRELKLDLLARLLLEEPETALPPAEVENPAPPPLPAEEVARAINRAPAWKVRMPRDEAEETHRT